MFRESYNHQHDVPRLEEEQALWAWLNQEPNRDEKRLNILEGPTGIGKSWLLAKIRERAKEAENYLVFWVDASEELSEATQFQNWLEQIVVCVQESGYKIDFHPDAQMSHLVAQIAQECCQNSAAPARWPLLLVDQADMLAPEVLRTTLEYSLLAPFLQEWCTRAIITLRSDISLTHAYLRRRTIPFPISSWSADQGREQLERRHSSLNLVSDTPGYEAISPGINSWLDKRIKEKGLLTVEDLYDCLYERTKDTAGNPLEAEAFDDLYLLSQSTIWTIEEFAHEVNCSPSVAYNRLGNFTRRAILIGHQGHYSLPEDLQGLILAYLTRRERG